MNCCCCCSRCSCCYYTIPIMIREPSFSAASFFFRLFFFFLVYYFCFNDDDSSRVLCNFWYSSSSFDLVALERELGEAFRIKLNTHNEQSSFISLYLGEREKQLIENGNMASLWIGKEWVFHFYATILG